MVHNNNELKRITCERKNHFLVLTLIILFMESVAWGVPQQAKRNLSCKTLRSMARVYMAYGEYTKAQPLAEQALNCAKERGESPCAARVPARIGSLN